MISSVIKYCLVMLLLAAVTYAQDVMQQQLSYADSLYDAGEYYDAITEYKRLRYFSEDGKYDYISNLKIGLCYKGGAKLDDAIRYLAMAEKSAETDSNRIKAKFYNVRCNILRRTTDRARHLLDELWDETSDTNQVHYWRGWTYIFEDKWESASVQFAKIDSSHRLKTLAENVENKKYSVNFAKFISYILPGAGQFYTGEYLSGFMSLGWNVLFGYLTVDALLEDRVLDGFLIGELLFLRFYRGNLQNAEKFAKQRNIEISNDALRYLQNKYEGPKP